MTIGSRSIPLATPFSPPLDARHHDEKRYQTHKIVNAKWQRKLGAIRKFWKLRPTKYIYLRYMIDSENIFQMRI